MKIIRWSARILSITYILFLSLFALDAFSETITLEIILGFIIHLIPSITLLIILLIAWKYEKVGGIIFMILGIVFTFAFDTYEHAITFLTISLPLIVVGALFLASYYWHKKRQPA